MTTDDIQIANTPAGLEMWLILRTDYFLVASFVDFTRCAVARTRRVIQAPRFKEISIARDGD